MSTLTRRRKIVPALAAAILAVAITAGLAPASAQAETIMPNGPGQPWRNPGQPPGCLRRRRQVRICGPVLTIATNRGARHKPATIVE